MKLLAFAILFVIVFINAWGHKTVLDRTENYNKALDKVYKECQDMGRYVFPDSKIIKCEVK